MVWSVRTGFNVDKVGVGETLHGCKIVGEDAAERVADVDNLRESPRYVW